MKTTNFFSLPGIFLGCLGGFLSLFFFCPALMSANAASEGPRTSWSQSPPPIDETNPQAAILKAEERFKQAEADFTAAENAEAKAAFAARQNATQQQTTPLTGSQGTSTQTAKPAASPPPVTQSTRQTPAEAREQALQGSPETGYSGTWTDPANGDIITSVIAPTPQPGNSQNYPIVIEPQVYGGGSSYASGSWGSESDSGWNSSWPQWPGYPGNPGYPIQPPSRPGGQFPYPPPGHWVGPTGPTDQPPPFPPGYRPLRPMPPYGWNQGPNQGTNPLPPQGIPGSPGFNPNPPMGGPTNPLPPQGIPGSPGFNPNPPMGGPTNPLPPQGIPGSPGFNPNPPMGGPTNPLPPQGIPGSPGFNPNPPPNGMPGFPPPNSGWQPGRPFPGNPPANPPFQGNHWRPFSVGPSNPGLQPGPGPLPNGPGPGFRPIGPRGGF